MISVKQQKAIPRPAWMRGGVIWRRKDIKDMEKYVLAHVSNKESNSSL